MSHLFEAKKEINRKAFEKASTLVEEKIKSLRANTPNYDRFKI